MATGLLMKNFIQSFETLKTCQKEITLELKQYNFFNELSINYSNINFITSFKKNFLPSLCLALYMKVTYQKQELFHMEK